MSEEKENKRVCNLSKLPFFFRCIDDEKVDVDPRCCDESNTIYHLWIDEFDGKLSMDMTSKIFKKVNYYCSERSKIMDEYVHDETATADKLEEFDYEFIDEFDLLEILDLWDAASILKINSLLDLTRFAIAEMIEEKSGHEILEIFHMPDFTLEAFEEMRDLNAWAFKRVIEAC